MRKEFKQTDGKKQGQLTRRTAVKAGSATIAGMVLGAGVHVASGGKRRKKQRKKRRRQRDERGDFEDFVKGVQNRTPQSLRKLLIPFSEELPRLNAPNTVAAPFPERAVPAEFGEIGTNRVRSEVYNRLAVNNTSSGGGRRPIAGEVGFLNGISTPEGELLEGPLLYEVTMRKGFHEFFPKVPTPVYGYHSSTLDGGVYPFDYLGPTMMTNAQVPIIVRYINDMGDVLTSIHQHGGHNSRVDDGHPADLIIPLGFDPHATPTTEFMEHLLEEERPSPFEEEDLGFKEYFFPHMLPLQDGIPDEAEAQSTMWYHDHAMDITAENVWRGLAAFYLNLGPIEERLVMDGILPDRFSPYDVPLVIQDRSFQADGSFYYDNLDHNGTLGDLFPINGTIQPVMTVERRKYRFRILNGSNARHYVLAVSGDEAPMVQVGTDSWLLPRAVERQEVLLSPGKRADVVIDFTDAPDEFYLENILLQNDGRGPKGKLDDPDTERPGFPLMKFKVEKRQKGGSDFHVGGGDELNPVHQIRDDEIVRTRFIEVARRKGAWVINHTFWNPMRNDTPGMVMGTAERLIIENGGGGWWHPMHFHLEGMQVQSINGKPRDPVQAGLQDMLMLGGGDVGEVYIKFRTFEGPFVFHCHTVEHEDMRMMHNINDTVDGGDGVLLPENQVEEDIEVVVAPEDREPGASQQNDD